MGDDVSASTLKFYKAYKKIKNFATMEIYQTKVVINFKLNPSSYQLNESLRDVSKIGHYGTGSLQLIIKQSDDILLARKLLRNAYESN